LGSTFGESAIKAFSKGNHILLMYLILGVYHWWYTILELIKNYIRLNWLLLLSSVLFAGWLHLQPKFRPSLSWFKNNRHRLEVIIYVRSFSGTYP
jgi:photosystem I P700 chlorophyll a apoprotein A2